MLTLSLELVGQDEHGLGWLKDLNPSFDIRALVNHAGGSPKSARESLFQKSDDGFPPPEMNFDGEQPPPGVFIHETGNGLPERGPVDFDQSHIQFSLTTRSIGQIDNPSRLQCLPIRSRA